MEKYSEYKDSGVEWIGKVPVNWDTLRMKYVFREINDRSEDGVGDLLSVSQYTGVTKRSDSISEGDMLTNASTLEGYKKVKAGDLVTNIMLAWNGSLGFSPVNGITSPAYSIYRLMGGNSERFFHYLLRTDKYKSEYKRNSTGVIESRLRLYSDDFFAMETLVPPLPTQTAIATFLDRKTAQIDRAIAQQERLIALLRERKQIVIQQAVTKGLDPTVKMKDSGVEWMRSAAASGGGEVPEHWEVKKLKYVGTISPRVDMKGSERCTFLPMDKIGEGGGIDTSISASTEKGGAGFTVFSEGDVLVAKITPCFENYKGAVARGLLNGIGFGTTELHVLRPSLKISSDFLFIISQVRGFREFATGFMYGSGGQKRVGTDFIKNSRIPLPPIKEQSTIVDFVNKISSQVDQSILLHTQQIAKLKEYRTVLIDAAVTGKIKVS